jgi:hypothetical protein
MTDRIQILLSEALKSASSKLLSARHEVQVCERDANELERLLGIHLDGTDATETAAWAAVPPRPAAPAAVQLSPACQAGDHGQCGEHEAGFLPDEWSCQCTKHAPVRTADAPTCFRCAEEIGQRDGYWHDAVGSTVCPGTTDRHAPAEDAQHQALGHAGTPSPDALTMLRGWCRHCRKQIVRSTPAHDWCHTDGLGLSTCYPDAILTPEAEPDLSVPASPPVTMPDVACKHCDTGIVRTGIDGRELWVHLPNCDDRCRPDDEKSPVAQPAPAPAEQTGSHPLPTDTIRQDTTTQDGA